MPTRRTRPTSQYPTGGITHGPTDATRDRDGWAQFVGRRVSLRRRVGTRDGRPLYTDAVGELSVDGAELVVHTRRGPVRVDPDTVVAVRVVPPPPRRRRESS